MTSTKTKRRYVYYRGVCLACEKSFETYLDHRGREPRFCSVACANDYQRMQARQTFLGHIRPPNGNGCRLWDGPLHRQGYGKVTWRNKANTAHRVRWELEHGPIPEGQIVLHTCDIRNCIEISHLYLGTHWRNTQDIKERGGFPAHWKLKPLSPAGSLNF